MAKKQATKRSTARAKPATARARTTGKPPARSTATPDPITTRQRQIGTLSTADVRGGRVERLGRVEHDRRRRESRIEKRRRMRAELAGQKVKVQAIQTGYYKHRRRRPGDVFVVPGEHFTPAWMRLVPRETPNRVTGPQAAIDQENVQRTGRLPSRPAAQGQAIPPGAPTTAASVDEAAVDERADELDDPLGVDDDELDLDDEGQ